MADKDIIDINQLKVANKDHANTILIISVIGAIILFVIGALDAIGGIETPIDWIQFAALGLMVICGPYGFYVSMKHKRIKEIEMRLPDFLRDVAEAGRFGMTLAEAVVVASGGRYGKLTPEIRRMAAQIDWGVPAAEAMRLFTMRVNTPLVNRMMSIIIKANDAGGNVADVLTMVAHDARETMLNQEERKIAMSTYMVVTYIAFFVFIATIIILNSTFLPRMVEAGSQVAEGAEGMNVDNMPTTIQTDIIPQVQFIFIAAVVIHGFGDGILAGVLQDGRISNGMRHSFIMLLIGLIGTSLL
ncbi:MAG: type II secretion system F family protein [Methanomassiliicoccales archaeon]|nr:type II secretion system F family protein [Methanomassiliicoccales archaeon]NYT15222.1 type II secretion system F family protein [Methanomassiliicoccales archaeon]